MSEQLIKVTEYPHNNLSTSKSSVKAIMAAISMAAVKKTRFSFWSHLTEVNVTNGGLMQF